MKIERQDRYFKHPIREYKEYKRIIFEPGIVTRIKLNRPKHLNVKSHMMFGELEDAFDKASQDPECRVIVLSGEGSCFSAGDDTFGLTPESAPTLVYEATPEELVKEYGSERAVWNQYNIEHDYYVDWWLQSKLRTVPKPTIAMVHGYCLMGAFSSACAMDVIFAAEDALFLSGRPTGTALWDWGPRKALEVAYEHRFVTAREALELGMVGRVFPDYETLEKETLDYAYRVAKQNPATLLRVKDLYLQVRDHQGFTAAYEGAREPFADMWRRNAINGNANRYEGKGMARTPVALANLKTKLESEGAEVPPLVNSALERAKARDDRASWQKALHQEWRDPERIARNEAEAKAFDDGVREFAEKEAAEKLKYGR